MKTTEYRELQVSSTQLAIIFIGILVLGVVIFLLGVSVGKKQARVAEQVNVIAEKKPEPVKDKISLPDLKSAAASEKPEVKKEPVGVSEERVLPQPAERLPASKPEKTVEEPKPLPSSSQMMPLKKGNLYYVQVGALVEKSAALETGDRFRKLGYEVVVLDPFPSDKTPLYRVRVGGYATRAEAESARSKLAAAAGRKVDYFIVRD